MRKSLLALPMLMLLLAACAAPTATLPPAASPSPGVSPSGTPTLTPTPTILPPTPTFTLVVIQGTLTIKVNVRSGPGTTYESLGLLEAGEKVQILNQDAAGGWYQVLYPAASNGRGWVAARYVTLPTGAQVPPESTPTSAGPTGVVVQRLNVRSGPGTTFDTLGLLEAKTVVRLTGKNNTASWFQIEYASGPGGRGWVTAQYIQMDDTAGLPVLDDYGTPVAAASPGASTSIPATPTPTIGPAYLDGDSASAPAVEVTFSATGTTRLLYSSQVSAPDGDGEDWVGFTPFANSGSEAQLLFSLSCTSNGSLRVELYREGSPVSSWGTLACGDMNKNITLPAGKAYELRVMPADGEGLRLVSYSLSIENLP